MRIRRVDQQPNPLTTSEGFATFYRDNADALLRYFCRRVYEPEIAVDLTAETFAQALLARNRFRGRTPAEAAGWVRGIAARQLARYYRSGAIERRGLERLGVSVPALTEADLERVEELADVEELRAALGNGLSELSAQQRTAIQLRVVNELPYPEVAARLGVSEQAARARVSRGLRALAGSLERLRLTQEAAR